MASAADLIAEARDKRAIGDGKAAIALQQQAIALLGDEEPMARGHALRHLAEMAVETGDCALATASISKAMELYRAHGDPHSLDMANAIRVEAVVAQACGDIGQAIAQWERARDAYAALDAEFERLGFSANPGVAEADERLATLRKLA